VEFFDSVLSGADLALDSPILALRERLDRIKTTKIRTSDRELLALFVITWNAFPRVRIPHPSPGNRTNTAVGTTSRRPGSITHALSPPQAPHLLPPRTRTRQPDRRPMTDDRKGRMWIGPTSDQTRRQVAESRLKQGLPPRIENPAVIESLALFLRNALDTLDRDQNHDRPAQERHP
jgi:hypothetical protein